MGVLDFGDLRRGRKGQFGGEFAASHCNQWGLFLHRCMEVHTAIKLSFGVVSGVGPDIHVLDEVHMPQGEGAVSGVLSGIVRHLRPILYNGNIRIH